MVPNVITYRSVKNKKQKQIYLTLIVNRSIKCFLFLKAGKIKNTMVPNVIICRSPINKQQKLYIAP